MLLKTILFIFVASLWTCHAQHVVGQWDCKTGGFASTNVILESNGFTQTNAVTKWTSRQGVALEFLQEDWLEGADALANIGGPEGCGLRPGTETASNQTVVAGIIVVKPYVLGVRAALLTGERLVGLANRPGGGALGHWNRVGPAEGVDIFVNGVPDAQLQAGVWQVVTFVLPAEVPLRNMMVAGDPGLASWKRTLQGEIRHISLLGGAEDLVGGVGTSPEPALRAMERVLAVRYHIPGIRPSTSQERTLMRAARLHDYGQFGTVFILK